MGIVRDLFSATKNKKYQGIRKIIMYITVFNFELITNRELRLTGRKPHLELVYDFLYLTV